MKEEYIISIECNMPVGIVGNEPTAPRKAFDGIASSKQAI
jgi:hypothetical protein